MKYGIKHKSGEIQAISRFSNNVVPESFTEITVEKYNEFINDISINPISTYDEANNEIIKDDAAYATSLRAKSKSDLRLKLKALSVELDLKARLEEDVTNDLNNFSAIKAQYEAL
ncbi:MAG: hypothetical protein WA775_03110 [Psychroserpens sp.]|uniref:hypothetical protein n=1 Tax=Psychroserpens sp. TaxID=2020870 RepID=UPI003C85BE5F